MELKIRIDGTDHRVQAQMIRGTLWVHHQGRTFTVETAAGQRSRKKASAGSSDQITSPMPGKITKILVKPGQDLTAGQAVLVMEAMKMEYTLKAEIVGQVGEILCAVGDQVVLGKTLVKIKASAEK